MELDPSTITVAVTLKPEYIPVLSNIFVANGSRINEFRKQLEEIECKNPLFIEEEKLLYVDVPRDEARPTVDKLEILLDELANILKA